jgi:hypothetical protein
MIERIVSPFAAVLTQAAAGGKGSGNRNPPRRFAPVMTDKAYDTPSEVTAEDGEVLVDGPDGVAVSLTPEAAAETSDRLLEQAAIARGQERLNGKRKPG